MVECGICFAEYQEGELELHRQLCVLLLVFRCTLCNVDFVNKEGLWNHLELHEIADESKELHYQEMKARHKLHQCVLCNDQRAYSESLYWNHIREVHDSLQSDSQNNDQSDSQNNDQQYCDVGDQTAASELNDLEIDPIKIENRTSDQDEEVSTKHDFGLKSSANSENLSPAENHVDGGRSRRSARIKYGNLDAINDSDSDGMSKKSISPKKSSRKSISSDTTCPQCNKEYATDVLLRRHIRIAHKPIKCSVCGIIKNGASLARYHKVYAHTDPKFECAKCQMKFHFKSRYDRHLKFCPHSRNIHRNHVREVHDVGEMFRSDSQNNDQEYCDVGDQTAASESNDLEIDSIKIENRSSDQDEEVSTNQEFSLKSSANSENQSPAVNHADGGNSRQSARVKYDNLDAVNDSDSDGTTEKSISPKRSSRKSILSDTTCPQCNKEYATDVLLRRHIRIAHTPIKCSVCGIIKNGSSLARQHKLLAQKLWQLKAGWDDPVDEDTSHQWQELQGSLSHLHEIEIPRRVTFDNVVAYELHGFSDASNKAYGACIYLRSIFGDGSAKLRLLTSKSKLAPLKDLSIPRKELCAALLLTRLVQKVLPALDMSFRNIVLWCDSTVVLAWIKKPLSQLQLFVRNRIAVIQEHTGDYRWEYVRSQQNPADIVSRGQLAEPLKYNSLWWSGPAFLQRVDYDVEPPEDVPDDELPELKALLAAPDVSMDLLSLFPRFSDFRKIQRVVGYVLRFAANCRKRNPSERERSPYLTVRELRRSTEAIMHVVQHAHFADEIRRVLADEPCKRLGNLRPIYHDGLLRVGGRLDRSQLPFESRHPIILPDKDPVVRLLIQQMHVELLHVGQSGLMNAMRQRYWLLNARSTIRLITRRCVRCFRTNPTTPNQLMGNLPISRVVPSPPFAVTGVDYAGPIWTKQGTRRPTLVKSYVAVYVCMATKAVHLECVSNLSTDAFMASLRRFIARRGMVHEIHSDNATNFRGANHELNHLYQQFRDQQSVETIEAFCRNHEIEWYFIPPDAPEFGGLWEAAVKSAKTHLKRVVGNTSLTFEEMCTILAEIEAVLNSRPLFTISNDPADPLVITPAHYLIGRPLTAPAEPSLEDIKASRLARWQHLQLLREQFGRAWSRDYLNTLQPRKKNLKEIRNIREGMIVLLHDRNQPPLNWKLARIVAIYPGVDGLVRAVDVFANGAKYRRPINKLSILPIADNDPLPNPSTSETC